MQTASDKARFKGRLVAWLVAVPALVAMIMVWVSAGSGFTSAEVASTPAGERILVVAAKDTLWDLAVAHAPEGMHRDAWIAWVAEANAIDTRRVRAGDALRIPAEEPDGAELTRRGR